jgi:hypothetical protein
MPLSCDCGDCGDAEWWYEAPDDYQTMPFRRRRVPCASCGTLIETGATVIGFERSRPARSDVELRIYGEDSDAVRMTPLWHCERCADLWWSLTELGYCVAPDQSMLELVREYAERRAEALP